MSVRFAPSPTGSFHIGNLRTAWVSKKLADALSVPWVVRIEDIDQQRSKKHFLDLQLKDLDLLSLKPEKILIQSQALERHIAQFKKAVAEGKVYPCQCSRRTVLQDLASAPHSKEALYSGHCRNRSAQELKITAQTGWRFRTDATDATQDFLIGHTTELNNLDSFLPSYHWACGVDDAIEGHQLIVRAYDLQQSFVLQNKIHCWINPKFVPNVFHTALVLDSQGQRLEKRSQGVTLAELCKSGATVSELLQRFEDSFNLQSAIINIKNNLGEVRKELLVTELLNN